MSKRNAKAAYTIASMWHRRFITGQISSTDYKQMAHLYWELGYEQSWRAALDACQEYRPALVVKR